MRVSPILQTSANGLQISKTMKEGDESGIQYY